MTALRLRAPAKLNLVLRVVGRRQDGYHLLETLFHAVALHDDLAARAEPAGLMLGVTADGPRTELPPARDNLVLAAARAFAAATGTTTGFRFLLHKRIPHGAGLGGGSSDAAAALRLCNQLCGAPLDESGLHRLAAGLGADVPFFLRGGSQWGRGIGDELAPALVPEQHFVLVVPPFDCPTAAVYKNLAVDWNRTFDTASIGTFLDPHHKESALHVQFANDLEPAAERVRPELKVLRDRIHGLGVEALHLTGSGSTWFVPARDAAAAAALRQRLQPLEHEGVLLLETGSDAAPQRVPEAMAAVEFERWCGEVRSWLH